MKQMKYICAAFFLCCAFICEAQKRGAVWCFGDSALIDFSDTANIITGNSIVKSRGSCVSISDTSGQLLAYAFTRAGVAGNTTRIYNFNHLKVQGGDSIVGEGWYHELVIIPFPNFNSLYYLFSIGVTGSSQSGLYYSVIDMSANAGLGAVIQKNVQLQSFKCSDGLAAIKHGNGRDWWIFFRRWDIVNNTFYKYLITPNTVSTIFTQNIGTSTDNGFGRMQFSNDGNKMLFYNYRGLMELYDFDRCTGQLSNPVTVYPENGQAPWPQDWSAEFSPSDSVLYVTHIAAFAPDSCYLIQYDLTAVDITTTADTLWRTPFMMNMGQLKLAPDKKIYLSNNFNGGYPYPDTTYNMYNMYLSVINSPDSLGASCNLQPYSFYLGGKRTYFGLPNNPDYDMPALAGSPCDSLTSIQEFTLNHSAELYVFYHPAWQTAFINAQKLNGKSYELLVYDILGNIVFKETGKINPPYYTKNLNCSAFAKGMYVVILKTERETLTKKFIIQ